MASKEVGEIPNCWEFMQCGEATCKVCPAYPDHGRECWKITGTRCAGGKYVKATFEEKILHCRNNCSFYKTHLKGLYP